MTQTTDSTFMGYSHEDLHATFHAICDPADWRAPIDAVVSPEHCAVAIAAVIYKTATEPKAAYLDTSFGMMVRVTSEGYREGPAGP